RLPVARRDVLAERRQDGLERRRALAGQQVAGVRRELAPGVRQIAAAVLDRGRDRALDLRVQALDAVRETLQVRRRFLVLTFVLGALDTVQDLAHVVELAEVVAGQVERDELLQQALELARLVVDRAAQALQQRDPLAARLGPGLRTLGLVARRG